MFKNLLIKLSEVGAQLLGSAAIDGIWPTLRSVPHYFSRATVKEVINPRIEVPFSWSAFFKDRFLDVFLYVPLTAFGNSILKLAPQNRLVQLTLSGIVRNACASMAYRYMRDETVLDYKKIKEEMLKGMSTYYAVGFATLILSDFIFDKDDNSPQSTMTYVLGGVAGELLFHYSGKAADKVWEIVSKNQLENDTKIVSVNKL